MRFADKVAIVTGGASGFGRTTVELLAADGASVVVADLDADRAAATVAAVVGAGGAARAVVADVATTEGARAVVDGAVTAFGGLDVLVNNAGISQGTQRDTWDIPDDLWDRVLAVNLRSVFVCTRAAVPHLVARGGGAVVNVASIAASCSVGGAAYAASKGGMLSYTRHVSHELAGRGVRVNCVSPGYMRTPMSTGERAGLTPEQQEAQLAAFGAKVPMGRVGGTDDIAEAICYLASDAAKYVTGQEIVVDGGYLVR